MKQKTKPRRNPEPYKARFIAYVAASVDGRISLSKNRPPDWTSKEDWNFFQKELGRCDAVVAGRNTFEGVSERLSKRNTFVFSRLPPATAQSKSVTFVNPGVVDLKNLFAPYRRVGIVGGAGVYQAMLDNGLMDELYVTIEPLVFGRGTEMFRGGEKTRGLRLMSVKKLNKKGTLLLRYEVLR